MSDIYKEALEDAEKLGEYIKTAKAMKKKFPDNETIQKGYDKLVSAQALITWSALDSWIKETTQLTE